jgi:hypothetical protein
MDLSFTGEMFSGTLLAEVSVITPAINALKKKDSGIHYAHGSLS